MYVHHSSSEESKCDIKQIKRLNFSHVSEKQITSLPAVLNKMNTRRSSRILTSKLTLNDEVQVEVYEIVFKVYNSIPSDHVRWLIDYVRTSYMAIETFLGKPNQMLKPQTDYWSESIQSD